MDWTALGIEPTTDKKAITMAYRKQLAHTNPEDKPEEFKALREAYEEALSLSKEAAQKVEQAAASDDESLSPLERWTARLETVYNDYQLRINNEEWRTLLADDVCIAIDTRTKAEEALFRFLSQERFLNHAVWQLFDARFSWLERRTELYEYYPRGFIDNVVVESIMYKSLINFNLFMPGKDAEVCDEYIRQFIRALNTPLEEAEPLALELLSFPEQNPYGNAYIAFVQAMNGSLEGLSDLRMVWSENQGEVYIAQRFIEALLEAEQFEEAETVARATRELDESNRHTIWLLASSLASQKRYKDGIECINDLMRTAGGDQHDLFTLSEIRSEWNLSLIDQYEAILAEDPTNNETLLDLSWCYLQNDVLDKSRVLADRLDREVTSEYDYYNLVSQLCLAEGDYEGGNTGSRKLAEIIAAMEPDGTDKTAKRIARLPGVIARCGYCLYCLKRREESCAAYEEALAIAPNDPDTLNEYARILVAFGDRKRGFEMTERLINVNPTTYFPYFMLAQLYFDDHNDRDAFMAVNRALELEGSDLGVYILKLRILIRNGAGDEARTILEYLKANGCADDLGVIWCSGLMCEFDAEMEGANRVRCWLKARAMYQEVLDRVEKGEEFGFAPIIYFRAAVLDGQINDTQSDALRRKQLSLVDKGLAIDPDDSNCLDYRAWLLVRLGRTDEAIEAYEKLVSLPHFGLEAEESLAELYRKDLKHYAAKAFPLYRALVESEPDNVFYLYYVALCCLRVRKLDMAEHYLLRERSLEPECTDPYRLLFFVYLAMNRNEDALAQINDCIRVAKDGKNDSISLYRMKTRVLRRMSRWDEAVQCVIEGDELYHDPERYRTIFEIYAQAGRYEDCERHLREWSKARYEKDGKPIDRSGIVRPRLLLALLRDGAQAAKAYGTKGMSYLRGNDKREFMMLVHYLNSEFEGCADILLGDIKRRTKNGDTDIADTTAQLAAHYWRLGELDKARKYAGQTLVLCDDILQQFTTYEPLWHTKRALALGILGSEDEARAELAEARSLPLCEQCAYPCCKDADFYEAYIEDFCGNYDRALELTHQGMTQWPDESDFWCFEQYLLSKEPSKTTDTDA